MSTNPEDLMNAQFDVVNPPNMYMSAEDIARARAEATGLIDYQNLIKFSRPEDFEGTNIDFSALGKQVVRAHIGNEVKRLADKDYPETEFDSSLQVVEFSQALASEMKEEYIRDVWLVDLRRASRNERFTEEAIRTLRSAKRADKIGAIVLAQGYDDTRPEITDLSLVTREQERAAKIAKAVKRLKVPTLVLNVVEKQAPVEAAAVTDDNPLTAHQISRIIREEYVITDKPIPEKEGELGDEITMEAEVTEDIALFDEDEFDEELRLLEQSGLVLPPTPVVSEEETPDLEFSVDAREL